ncbi:hypothetical protein [Rhizosaccharibacter radicis]|uniref:DsrE family protein n=1 Tax=Rhizosaccharibacter radicis TaxID=2782605 RepID=A0ABT1W0E4_9PROT|nr:DsrE family protein [Acetobacteraceae bacterium KSS12]
MSDDRSTPPPARTLGLLMIDRRFERAHYAFVLAAGAAAIDRPVVMFATNGALHAFCRDWRGLDGAVAEDERLRGRGVAGLEMLREAVAMFDVPLLACEAGLRAEGIERDLLLPGVAVAGVPEFLHRVDDGQMLTL